MPAKVQTLLADKPLPDPKTLNIQPTPQAAKTDPLIDKGGQNVIFLGSALLAVGIVAAVGVFSRKIEHLIIAALVLSLVLISMFLFIGR